MSSLIDVRDVLNKRLAVIGSGGRMGLQVCELLLRAGVGTGEDGRICLIDGQDVEVPNLLYGYCEADVKKSKVDAQAEHLLEINSSVNVNKRCRRITRKDKGEIVSLARDSHLLCWFIDDPVVSEMTNACHDICPQVQAHFLERADVAEVAISIPGVTPPLTKTLGHRRYQSIGGAQALGVDVSFVTSFVAGVCLRLLIGDGKGADLLPAYGNAPLYVIGLRRALMFSDMPQDQIRSIYVVAV
ncbi:MAG: ThiF family adenylyltransferase [Phycisphaeraceae bacterium]|nr:ThiF family adenylyltransferase [Phycisphaeraceae bacterium]